MFKFRQCQLAHDSISAISQGQGEKNYHSRGNIFFIGVPEAAKPRMRLRSTYGRRARLVERRRPQELPGQDQDAGGSVQRQQSAAGCDVNVELTLGESIGDNSGVEFASGRSAGIVLLVGKPGADLSEAQMGAAASRRVATQWGDRLQGLHWAANRRRRLTA